MDEGSILGIPHTSPPPTDPIILNMISTYLVYAIIIKTHLNNVAKSIEELASLSCSSTHSLLHWLPAFAVLPQKHIDSLLTRAYTVLNKLSSTASSLSGSAPSNLKSKTQGNTTVSPESIFKIRFYALQCLVHTSPGVIDPSTFWDQCGRYAAILVKSTTLDLEEQTNRLLLTSFSELVRLAYQRPDRETYLSIGEKGKNFVAFCEYWTGFAKRVGLSLFDSFQLIFIL